MSTLVTCSHCGAAGLGTPSTVVVHEADIRAMAELFAGRYDFDLCGACNYRQNTQPEVHVRLNSGAVLRRSARSSSGIWLPPDASGLFLECASGDELRAAVAESMRSRRMLLDDMTRAQREGQFGDWLEEHWSQMTADLFRVANLIMNVTVPMPGFSVWVWDNDGKLSEPLVKESDISNWAMAQAIAWSRLVVWISETPPANLEQEMSRFIAPGGVLSGATRIFAASILPELIRQRPHLTVGSPAADERAIRYLGQAILASACVAAGEENSEALDWAYLFFLFEADLASGQADPSLTRLQISQDRAKATIKYNVARDAAIATLRAQDWDFVLVQLVADRAGHSGLLSEILGRNSFLPPNAPLDSFERMLMPFFDHERAPIGVLLPLVEGPLRNLVQARDLTDFENLVAFASDRARSPEQRAAVEIVWGRQQRSLRRPRAVLDRLGEDSGDWEEQASPSAQALLCSERAHALRLLCRLPAARRLIERAFELGSTSSEAAPDVSLAAAALLRASGQPVNALKILEDMLQVRWLPYMLKLEILESIATTNEMLGRRKPALAAVREAIGTFGMICPDRVRALEAYLLADTGHFSDAETVLGRLGKRELDDPQRVIWEALTWAALLEWNQTAVQWADIERVLDRLCKGAIGAAARDDLLARLDILHAFALLSNAVNPQTSEGAWWQAFEARRGLAPDPLELTHLARFAYRAGRPDAARNLLAQVPKALALRYGDVVDVAVASGATDRLGVALRSLGGTIMPSQPIEDLRLVNELQRDALGRAKWLTSALPSSPANPPSPILLSDESLRRLAPTHGVVGVLEWIEVDMSVITLFTTISVRGVSTRQLAPLPTEDARRLALRLRTALDDYQPYRPRDPLESPDWRAIELWLYEELHGELSDDDHLVILEHPILSGLPWHAILHAPWTSSYAAGWTELLALESAGVEAPSSLGVVWVPRALEKAEVLEAMEKSVANARTLAAHGGYVLSEVDHVEGDAQRLADVMEACDVVKLICHGFVSPAEEEVAIMLAFDGRLPLAISAASGLPAARVHRFGWRDCQRLARSPRVVWSAGCSTGTSHPVGLGERLGFFRSLRSRGTRSIVAPRWDIFARQTYPILDDAMERNLIGHIPLATALRDACRAATSTRSVAWSLCLEGDWH